MQAKGANKMIKITRRIFSRTVVFFVPYTLIYGVLWLLNIIGSWHFWIISATIAFIILTLLIVIPGIIVGFKRNIDVEDIDIHSKNN
jgi:uncharacterized membrane protein